MGKHPKKLLDRVHETIRIKHHSIHTEVLIPGIKIPGYGEVQNP